MTSRLLYILLLCAVGAFGCDQENDLGPDMDSGAQQNSAPTPDTASPSISAKPGEHVADILPRIVPLPDQIVVEIPESAGRDYKACKNFHFDTYLSGKATVEEVEERYRSFIRKYPRTEQTAHAYSMMIFAFTHAIHQEKRNHPEMVQKAYGLCREALDRIADILGPEGHIENLPLIADGIRFPPAYAGPVQAILCAMGEVQADSKARAEVWGKLATAYCVLTPNQIQRIAINNLRLNWQPARRDGENPVRQEYHRLRNDIYRESEFIGDHVFDAVLSRRGRAYVPVDIDTGEEGIRWAADMALTLHDVTSSSIKARLRYLLVQYPDQRIPVAVALAKLGDWAGYEHVQKAIRQRDYREDTFEAVKLYLSMDITDRFGLRVRWLPLLEELRDDPETPAEFAARIAELCEEARRREQEYAPMEAMP